MSRQVTISLLAVLVVVAAGCSGPPGRPTPQRPTFSSDATTTEPGTVEVEAGLTLDPGDYFDSPVTLKFGVTETSELFIRSAPYQWIELPGSDGEGIGDTFVGVRQRVLDPGPGEPGIAYQLTTKIPTAERNQGLSTGELDFFAAAIASVPYDASILTGFYQLGILGDPGGGDPDIQHGIAFAGTAPLTEELGVFGELSAFITPERDDEQGYAIGGLTLPYGDSVVFDAGVALGLTRDAADFQIFVGLTYNLGHSDGGGRSKWGDPGRSERYGTVD